jgi:transcriptional regulator of arginine metabolism
VTAGTAGRRRALRRILLTRDVHSQRQLAALLGAAGHRVTQATVSRDLDAIGAIKDRTSGGRYTVPDGPVGALDPATGNGARRAAGRAITDFVESIAASANLVVVRTPPGAAHLVAGAIDHAGLEGVVGTVAGDDTLLVVAAEQIGGAAVASALERMGAAG